MSESHSVSANQYILQPLTEADVEQMLLVEQSAHSHPWSQAVLASCFGKLYRVTGIYNDQQTLLGFAIVQQIVDEVTLMDICVHQQAQGLGLGKQLLEQVITEAKQHNAVSILLEVRASNQAAIGLYLSQGFNQSGIRKNYYPTDSGKEDAVLMDYQFR
ncbi:ribosomal protein S18-alanine N-acetyltransferase [Shewanella sp. WXL01]|uniref:ribosomal protein S18-alanine N-acetyltransferase n=1 Tax=Shewanella sp. WXL01 TaxID=2709721 RepID=UPI0014386A1A|nr:ribosomal protein S18-alanine N-acetyltransferase [Shewanella sp. WXL01]NKF49561.1 ribosomal protein S18-alanine N-acetyltransferase [Shewanella sp. WXL01]